METEVVRAVLHEAGITGNFKVLPWARALHIARDTANVLIYSIDRTAERENTFKWVGDIGGAKPYIYCLADRDISLASIESAQRYKVGTIIGDSGEAFFLAHGFIDGKNMESVATSAQNYAKLKSGRIDLWPVTSLVMAYVVRQAGDDPKTAIKPIFELNGLSGYDGSFMAFGPNSDDDLVEALRHGLETIKLNGSFDQILKRWQP
jgi:polar amino acid transport system substrate-binding protein